MPPYQQIALADDRHRAAADAIIGYLRHLSREVTHPSPRPGRQYDLELPGLLSLNLVIYAPFGQVSRQVVCSGRWSRENVESAYSRDWLASHGFDPARLDALAAELRSHLDAAAPVAIHVAGLGLFASAPRAAGSEAHRQIFCVSPVLQHALNSPEQAAFAPSDADLRIPASATAGLDDGALCAATFAHLWYSLPLDADLAALYGNRVTRGQLHAFSTSWLCKEVQNGGFEQFFANSTGNLGLLIRAALDEIGAPAYLRLFDRALAVFPPSGYPTDVRERRAYLEQHDSEAELASLSEELYRLLDTDPLEAHMARYIRAHPAEFFRD